MSYILDFLFSAREALSSPSQFVYYALALLDNAIQNNTNLTIAERGAITALEQNPSYSGSYCGGAETSAPPPPPDRATEVGDSVSASGVTPSPSPKKVVRVPEYSEPRESAHRDELHHPLQGSSAFSALTTTRLKRNADAARFVAMHAQFHQFLQLNPQFVLLKELLLSQDALWSRESEGPMPLVYTDEEMAQAAALLPPEQLENENDNKSKKKTKKPTHKQETPTDGTYTNSEVETPHQLSSAEAVLPRANSVVVRRETLYDVFYNGNSCNLQKLVDDINRGLAETTPAPPQQQQRPGENGSPATNNNRKPPPPPPFALKPEMVFELHAKCKEVARLNIAINTTVKQIHDYEARILKEKKRSVAARAFTKGKRRDLDEKLARAQKEFETLSESYKETLKIAHQLLTRNCEEVYFCFKRKFLRNCRMLADALHVEMSALNSSAVGTQSQGSVSLTRREDTLLSPPQSLSATRPTVLSPNTATTPSPSASKGKEDAKDNSKNAQKIAAKQESGDDLGTLDRPVSFQLTSPLQESYHSGPSAADAEAAAMLGTAPATTVNTSAHHQLMSEDSAASRLRPDASIATTAAPPSNPLAMENDPNGISAADLAAINTLQEEESVNLFFSGSSSVPDRRIRDLSKLKHRKGETSTQAAPSEQPPDPEQSQGSADAPPTVPASADNRDVTDDSMSSATKRNTAATKTDNSNGGGTVYSKELVLSGVRTREIFFRYFFFHACRESFFHIFTKHMLAFSQFRRIAQKLNYNLPHRVEEDMKQLDFFLSNLTSDKSKKAYDKLDQKVFAFRKKLEVLQWRNKSVQEAKEKIEACMKKLQKGPNKALEEKLEKWQDLKSTRQAALNDYLQSNFDASIFDMLSYYTEFLALTESSLNQFLSSVPDANEASQDA